MIMTTMGVLMVSVTGVFMVSVMKTVMPVMVCVVRSVVPVVRRGLMGNVLMWVTVISHTVVPVVVVATMEGYPRGRSVVEAPVVVTVHV